MAKINTTGNADIDEATAEIAMALRDASPYWLGQQEYYDAAMRLRDAIMTGTRQLDIDRAVRESEPPLDIRVAGDRERILAKADAAVARIQERFQARYKVPGDHGTAWPH